ncbi:MAG TPA: acyl-CoA dehydrogenase family protein, partial [Ottowia sp.]|nr:acyl-CoA dehydrogenase family protein [Ottowia sp.]
MNDIQAPMSAAELREARSALVETVERFARSEIAPNVSAWDAAGEFPRSLYRRAAELGLLGVGYPEEYGGTPAPYALRLPMWRALCRFGTSGGVQASLFSHNIGLPPVVLLASDAVRQEVVPPVLAGERISALAITEPGGGSDVAQLRTTARREGDEYVVSGEKIFITSGMRADWITLAVRTGESKGASGISLLLVPGDSAG